MEDYYLVQTTTITYRRHPENKNSDKILDK